MFFLVPNPVLFARKSMQTILAQLIDLHRREIYPAQIGIAEGKISHITRAESAPPVYAMPGFVDAHIHIESSMLVPSEFARVAVQHGTVATVSDPHEIVNVLGVNGVRYMVSNGRQTPFKFFFGASPCVPATIFETAGAVLKASDIEELFQNDNLPYLAEVMNYPGVIHSDPELMAKIALAHKFGKPLDGHAPGLRGEGLRHYVAAGITTDHECFGLEEALEKIALGMKILIREGSAAKNFDALHPILGTHPQQAMFCSDDKHPDELLLGHINLLAVRAIDLGYDVFDVLRCACVNPVLHYGLPVGLLRPGDPADFILVDDPKRLRVLQTYINGEKVYEQGQNYIASVLITTPNRFEATPKSAEDFAVAARSGPVPVIQALDGQIITGRTHAVLLCHNGQIWADPERDILKIAVVCRYTEQPVAVAFVQGFGLRQAAIASSVAHDSHNIVVVGDSEQFMAQAVNLIIEKRGGISLASRAENMVLPLPVAGIMSDRPATEVGALYAAIDQAAKAHGSTLRAPFMTLSFMALPVIPELKITDRGLFDVSNFSFVEW